MRYLTTLALTLLALCLPLTAAAQELPPRPEPPLQGESGQGEREEADLATGRITGTVIDLTSGAPVAGVAVLVGDATVRSDANGNYDRPGLPAGSYRVALLLDAGQGAPAQAPLDVAVAADSTVVQHLALRGPVVPPVARAEPAELPATGGAAPAAGWLSAAGALLVAGALLQRRGARGC